MPGEEQIPASPFDVLIGTEWISDDPDDARARVPLREDLLQPYGLLHGGVVSTLVESLCSRATAIAVFPEGKLCLGQTVEVSLLRPARARWAEARARARHRGRTSWVWEVDVVDAEESLCAVAKMVMAIRSREEISRRSGS